MFSGKILQKEALFLFVAFVLTGSLNLATASPLRNWEGSFDGIESEDTTTAPRGGFGEETMPVPEDAFPIEVVEVAAPKRQNETKMPRKSLAMAQFPLNAGAEIKDETATTGENAKKRLPSSVKRQETMRPPFMHDIHQVASRYLSMDFQPEEMK